jgi:hypothetical protein
VQLACVLEVLRVAAIDAAVSAEHASVVALLGYLDEAATLHSVSLRGEHSWSNAVC